MAQLPDGRALPGKLFIVEGIDGSGKSTQLDLLSKWLVGQGYCVAFSEWNSSPLVKATTKKGKKKQMLTPTSFSLIHAADLADRLERQILPALTVISIRHLGAMWPGEFHRSGCARFMPSLSSRPCRSTSECLWKSLSSGFWVDALDSSSMRPGWILA